MLFIGGRADDRGERGCTVLFIGGGADDRGERGCTVLFIGGQMIGVYSAIYRGRGR